MRPVDMLGFGPKYQYHVNADGSAVVTVTPSKMAGDLPSVAVSLTRDQFARFSEWRFGATRILIQDALSDLSPSDREKLMTGLGDDDFKRIAGGSDA